MSAEVPVAAPDGLPVGRRAAFTAGFAIIIVIRRFYPALPTLPTPPASCLGAGSVGSAG